MVSEAKIIYDAKVQPLWVTLGLGVRPLPPLKYNLTAMALKLI